MLNEIYEILSKYCDNNCDYCKLDVEVMVDDERITLCDLIGALYDSEVFS